MTKITVIKRDITEQDTEAIVNSANPRLTPGGGLSGQIHRKAGEEMTLELKKMLNKDGLGFLEAGKAVLSSGGNLPAKYIIHTIGPKITVNRNDWPEVLAKSYQSILDLAVQHGIKSLSIPSISTGIYGCPIAEASVIAVETIRNYLAEHPNEIEEIRFVMFSDEDYQIYKDLIQ